jgi:hypothetical protein
MSSVQTIRLAFNLVQYRTCNAPELRPGKKSAICLHVEFFISFSLTSKTSSSGENWIFGPLGLAAGSGMPGCPTTDDGPEPTTRDCRVASAWATRSSCRHELAIALSRDDSASSFQLAHEHCCQSPRRAYGAGIGDRTRIPHGTFPIWSFAAARCHKSVM